MLERAYTRSDTSSKRAQLRSKGVDHAVQWRGAGHAGDDVRCSEADPGDSAAASRKLTQ
jgi:hypothetical protein